MLALMSVTSSRLTDRPGAWPRLAAALLAAAFAAASLACDSGSSDDIEYTFISDPDGDGTVIVVNDPPELNDAGETGDASPTALRDVDVTPASEPRLGKGESQGELAPAAEVGATAKSAPLTESELQAALRARWRDAR